MHSLLDIPVVVVECGLALLHRHTVNRLLHLRHTTTLKFKPLIPHYFFIWVTVLLFLVMKSSKIKSPCTSFRWTVDLLLNMIRIPAGFKHRCTDQVLNVLISFSAYCLIKTHLKPAQISRR